MKETSDNVDNFVDKTVDNEGITVENVWKRGIKVLAPKEIGTINEQISFLPYRKLHKACSRA